jgi:N-acyl homoserine lactone hydrolase
MADPGPKCLEETVMREYTIHPLAVGINETDQGVMTYLRDYGKRMYLPIPIHDPAVGRKTCIEDRT